MNERTKNIFNIKQRLLATECGIDSGMNQNGQLFEACAEFVKKIWNFVLWFVLFVLKTVIKLMFGFISGAVTASLVIPAVYEARGYSAVGGEVFLIFAAVFGGILIADELERRIGMK
ncbi:MAG: hypothetical protein HFE62_05065 [Firmicutes bacterium]|nr:hypothetical protein [Bacillota bacterium]